MRYTRRRSEGSPIEGESLKVCLRASGGPAVRQQFVELLDGMRSDAGEHVLKPCERVHFRQFAGCHEASQYRHGLAAAITAYESPVVPADRDTAQRSLRTCSRTSPIDTT